MYSTLKLEDVLKKKSHTAAFRAFLQQEYSEENLNFWLECEVFKKLKTTSKLNKLAAHIKAKYIDENAPEQVNIDAETRFELLENLKKITKNSFYRSQQHIFLLMATDSYKRFQTQEAEKCKCSTNNNNNNNNNNLSSAAVISLH